MRKPTARTHTWLSRYIFPFVNIVETHKLFIESRKTKSNTREKEKKRPKKKERRRKISGGVRARQRDEHAGELAINTRSVCRQFISSLNRIAQSVAHIFPSQKSQKLKSFKMKFIVLVRQLMIVVKSNICA
jgi:hypothetical protein